MGDGGGDRAEGLIKCIVKCDVSEGRGYALQRGYDCMGGCYGGKLFSSGNSDKILYY